MMLLTTQNHKTLKGEKSGWATATINLAPANESIKWNMCPKAVTCKAICLNTSGQNVYPRSKSARIRRTRLMMENRQLFLEILKEEIEDFVERSQRRGLKPAIRPNCLSDQAWLGKWCAESFPQVQVYDYTKLPAPWTRTLENYHIVFSYDGTEENHWTALDYLSRGGQVAVVFHEGHRPRHFLGVPVVDGDKDDLQWLLPKGVVIGLKAKGAARHDQGKFVQGRKARFPLERIC